MFVRFLALLSLLVAVALANIAIEKQILEVKRAQTVQVYQTEVLLERHARLRMRIEELTGPTRTSTYLQADETSSSRGRSQR